MVGETEARLDLEFGLRLSILLTFLATVTEHPFLLQYCNAQMHNADHKEMFFPVWP